MKKRTMKKYIPKDTVKDKDVKAFGEYLLGCCEYMLIHGDPI